MSGRLSDDQHAIVRAMGPSIAKSAHAFDAGTPVFVGATRQAGNGRAFFVLSGQVNGQPVRVHVLVPTGLKSSDAWIIWRYELERQGAAVLEDSAYSAAVSFGNLLSFAV